MEEENIKSENATENSNVCIDETQCPREKAMRPYFAKVSDLYAMEFNPVASKADFVSLSGDEYYKIQNEQKSAYERKNDRIRIYRCIVLCKWYLYS